MNAIIYYFTGTGNSLNVAKDLHKKLTNCQLINIASLEKQNVVNIESDIVGIIYPVYWLGPPAIVNRFIDKINASSSTYFFAACTFGAANGQSIWLLNKRLEKKGLKLNSGFSICMPANCQAHYKPTPKIIQKIEFRNKNKKIKKITKIVNSLKTLKIKKNLRYPDFVINKFYNGFLNKCNKTDNDFWIDSSCNNCKICEKICPVDNITITVNNIKWNNRCEFCLACLQWCPQKAIQYKKNTLHKLRYQNPEVTLNEMLVWKK